MQQFISTAPTIGPVTASAISIFFVTVTICITTTAAVSCTVSLLLYRLQQSYCNCYRIFVIWASTVQLSHVLPQTAPVPAALVISEFITMESSLVVH